MTNKDRITEFHTKSAQETEKIAAGLAENWKRPLVVSLTGPLGAGKTTFIRGLVRELGGDPDLVRSPTFTLINQYDDCDPPLVHADLYRAAEVEAQETIGLEEYFGRELVVVEWGGRWQLGWPENFINIDFSYEGPDERMIKVIEGESDAAGN